MSEIKIQKVDDFSWRIPREGKMRTHGVIYADESMMNAIRKDQSLSQVVNVENQDVLIPCILEPDDNSKGYHKNWARLIRKIYEVDLLTCPQGQGQMRIISSIEDPEVIKKILKHLGLWLAKRRP